MCHHATANIFFHTQPFGPKRVLHGLHSLPAQFRSSFMKNDIRVSRDANDGCFLVKRLNSLSTLRSPEEGMSRDFTELVNSFSEC